MSEHTPHVRQYRENGFGIPLDSEHTIPVQWDHNNQTWRAYCKDDPSKPTLPITYQENIGHWIINHNTGLPGGAPTGKNWAQFSEKWLDKMQDYVCGLLGHRQSHVTEHVGQPEHKLRALVDQDIKESSRSKVLPDRGNVSSPNKRHLVIKMNVRRSELTFLQKLVAVPLKSNKKEHVLSSKHRR